ncbi:MAG: hypothetical protein D8M58_08590 [Calditrichaeota bacterium]|nr:MAG: hypothetical protein DWQ03_17900 [Calditrichota bacterium]MBL1205440.1 hypothetical protein [Calditrichota bacterium]NOG45269.1 hypothetical protein [Calditrichota bacterium]
MAKYNLLEDDDIFDEEEDLTEDEPTAALEDKQEIDTSDDIDIDIDEDLLNIESTDTILDEQDLQEDIEIDSLEEEVAPPEPEPVVQELEPEIETEIKQPELEEEKPFLTDDFEDDKQSGINYKPIVIGGIIVIFLLLGYVALDTWVFTGSDSAEEVEPTDTQAKTPEQIAQEQQAERKAKFLSQVAGKTSSDISAVNSAIQNAQSSAKLSSVLLYGESFMFQVFGSDRSEIARVNMGLKENMASNNFTVISSQSRPGSNGGVFGIFKGTLSSSGAASSKNVQQNFNTINDLESWINNTTASSGLKVKSLDSKYVKEESDFRKFEVETTITGSIDACNAFLKKMSSDVGQLQIHKLNLNAIDQKTFQSQKYQLKLILEVFV